MDGIPECTGDLLASIESTDYCGYIIDTTGPFGICLSRNDLTMEFNDCVYDVCAASPDPTHMKNAACRSMAVAATNCKVQGSTVSADWRDITDCGEDYPAVQSQNVV